MKASSAAAAMFSKVPRARMAHMPSISPKTKASERRPLGIGRMAVRAITASMSASYHILSAPAAPAPAAMQRRATTPAKGSMPPGAIIRPTSAVKTTSDITRGFVSATQSPMLA